jgi:predicted transcriptional regulator
MSSKNRVTVNLSDEEFSSLNRLAARSKVSKAWLVRHALCDLLAANKEDQQLSLPLAGVKRGNAR